jgi:hypothetical protein
MTRVFAWRETISNFTSSFKKKRVCGIAAVVGFCLEGKLIPSKELYQDRWKISKNHCQPYQIALPDAGKSASFPLFWIG